MLRVYEDLEALSETAAALFTEEAQRAVAAHGRFDVLLSGGETPRRCYSLLAEEPLRDAVPWPFVHIFWGDERWVPHDDPRSNFGMSREALLDRLPLGEGQIHPVPYQKSPEASAASYEAILRRHFGDARPRFDLALLGLGEDGHTASLFPGSPVLDEQSRLVSAVSPSGQELHRVTVTVPVLNDASVVAFLVSGSAKAAALKAVLEGAREPRRLPAQLIQPSRGRLLWLVDRAAAASLSEA